MNILDSIPFFVYGIITTISIPLIGRHFEKRFPVDSEQYGGSSTADVIVDWKLAAVQIGSSMLLSPMTTACSIMLVNAAGGGWIHLRSDGWWFLLSVIVAIVALDFWTYLVHRAQHKIPLLWAMHSLHHSAESLSVITGARHFWFEGAIGTAFIPVVGIVFKIPPDVMTVVAWLYLLPDGLAHLNVRLSLGRFALCLNNPQYHRIHHSVEPEHWNKNFCKGLPVFDVIFGTAWKPGKDEFPATGLAGEKATGFVDGFIWPIRHWLSWSPARSFQR
jgi:sterol desaturase/sphingolipid hydroxylase (fatty acid hydroxylase superfamily)